MSRINTNGIVSISTKTVKESSVAGVVSEQNQPTMNQEILDLFSTCEERPLPFHSFGYFYISHEEAAWILANKNNRNRNKKDRGISTYAQDMENGNWKATHQGIAFYYDGELADGQNRLSACIETQTGFWTLAFFGVPDEAGPVTDIGIIRTVYDSACTSGKREITKTHTEITNRITLGGTGGQNKQSRLKRLDSSSKHKEACDFAISCLNIEDADPVLPGIKLSSVYAVIARAWYHRGKHVPVPSVLKYSLGATSALVTEERLREFGQVLIKNRSIHEGQGDDAALTLRISLIGDVELVGSKHSAMKYRKVQGALIRFLVHKSATKCTELDVECFPLVND